MPRIKINDQLRSAFSVDPNPANSLGKYLRNPASINLKNLANLDELPFQSLEAGLEFESPVGLGTDDVELTVGAGLSGALTVFIPIANENELFSKQRFGEPVEVALGHAYVSAAIIASVDAGLSGKASDLSFGFHAGSTTTVTSYARLSIHPEMPRLQESVKAVIEEFVIPGDLHDLEQMRPGAIATVEGSGTLKFSARANLLAAANPIASVEVPVAGTLALKAGATVTVGSSLELSCEYQIRVEKLESGQVRLGYYKKQGSDFSLRIGAQAGIATGIRNTDPISSVLGAISSNPVNAEELRNAGLSEARINSISKALKEGVNSKLELAVSAQFGGHSSKAAAFLFDIDIQALDTAGRTAVHNALDGNLEALTGSDVLPAGITLRRSILSTVESSRQVLKLNIFGIYDLLSLTTILREGSVINDPINGLTILDKITATRIQATVGQLDSEKLRKLLADSFLVTAAYRGSKFEVGPPELKSTHSYFELHGKTNHQTMKDNLEIAEALQLLTQAEKQERLDGISDFGRTTLLAETEYDSALCRSMFLDDQGRPLPQDVYDRAGLAALALLVQSDDPDSFRRRPATDPALWEKMRNLGQFNFKQLFPDLDPVRLENIVGDFTLIRWWSKTMSETAAILAQIEATPTHDPEDNRFKKVRSTLAKHLESVTKRTAPRWGDPWGLVAMDVLTRQAAGASVQITGPKVNLLSQRGQQEGVLTAGGQSV